MPALRPSWDARRNREDADDEVSAVWFQATCQRPTVLPPPFTPQYDCTGFVFSADRSQPCVRTPDLPDVCSATQGGSHVG